MKTVHKFNGISSTDELKVMCKASDEVMKYNFYWHDVTCQKCLSLHPDRIKERVSEIEIKTAKLDGYNLAIKILSENDEAKHWVEWLETVRVVALEDN
jgi:hypothetical protein